MSQGGAAKASRRLLFCRTILKAWGTPVHEAWIGM